jgi:hypothetical protein
MLNSLDDLKKAIDAASDAAKKANNAALVSRLQNLATARTALFDTLGTDVQGEGTLQETKLHEDLQSAYFGAQGLNTPAVTSFIKRVDAEYRAGVARYNAFVKTVPPVNGALKAAGIKTLPEPKEVSVK